MDQRGILALLIGALLAAGAACPNQPQIQIEDPPYDSQNDLVRLEVTPTYVNFGTEDREDLTVIAKYETGGDVDVTGQVDWFVGDDAVAIMDGAAAVGQGVGLTHVYATLGSTTSNSVTIEVGYFTYTIDCVDPKQANITLCTVKVDGRELDIDHPEYIEFTIEGFIPFGHDREPQGLDGINYFWVEDDDTFKARFLIPPSLPAGNHDVTFQVEGITGEGDSTVTVAEHILPLKRCNEVITFANLQAFDERKYRVIFEHDKYAYRIDSTTTVPSELDTALWLFDDAGNLFTWTDDPWNVGTDAVLPFGVTEYFVGEFFLILSASPYATSGTNEYGYFEVRCHEEEVTGDEHPGEQEVEIVNGVQPTDLDLTVHVGVSQLIDHAWVHVDLETDVPSQVSIALVPADAEVNAIGLRSTGYDADHLAVTWADGLVDPDSGYLSNFINSDPNGTWTLQVNDFSAAGTTVVHDWRLYLETSPP